jgi:hypothetical protein
MFTLYEYVAAEDAKLDFGICPQLSLIGLVERSVGMLLKGKPKYQRYFIYHTTHKNGPGMELGPLR